MSCDCQSISQLWDDEAREYADRHLEEIGLRSDGTTVLYRCPDTDCRWVEEYVAADEAGVGRLRLRRLV